MVLVFYAQGWGPMPSIKASKNKPTNSEAGLFPLIRLPGSSVVRIMLMWTELRACYKTGNPGTLHALMWRNLEKRDTQEVYPQKSLASVLYLTRTS